MILVLVGSLTILLVYVSTTRITLPLRRLAATADIVTSGKLDIEPVEIIIEDAWPSKGKKEISDAYCYTYDCRKWL